MCCQVEVSATSWSLVQSSPTDCDESLCAIKKPQEWGGHGPHWAAAPQKTYKQLLLFGRRSNCLKSGRSRSQYLFIRRGIKQTVCNNYRGISLLPTTYKSLSNTLLSRLIPYAKEIIGDHQCAFRRNRSTIDHTFCIRQTVEKKWEYNEEVHQLFIDFKEAYDC